MRLSIIIPAHNEEATILEVLRAIRAHPVDGVSYEVIVIDDGSKDGTKAALEAHPDLYTTLIARPVNGGKGAAVRDGLRAATGDYVLFQDADLEYSPADYGALVAPVTDHRADAVLGSRVLAPRMIRVHYYWHLLGNRLLTLFFNVLYNLTFTDIYSCYLLYRRDLVDPEDLRSTGWEQHAEILCTVARRGKSLYEVPVSYAGRTYEEGKKIRWWHTVPVAMMILRQRLAVR